MKDRWVVGVSGASGMKYGLRLIEVLSRSVSEVHAVFSESALRVLAEEEGMTPSKTSPISQPPSNLIVHSPKDIGSPIASGSFRTKGMVVIPCSMSTLGAIAHGTAQNALHRAAEVTMKEGRKLVLVPRETPLSPLHLRNMLTLAELGVAIVPAMPGFYHRPTSIADLVDMMVMKVLDVMGVENNLAERWKDPK